MCALKLSFTPIDCSLIGHMALLLSSKAWWVFEALLTSDNKLVSRHCYHWGTSVWDSSTHLLSAFKNENMAAEMRQPQAKKCRATKRLVCMQGTAFVFMTAWHARLRLPAIVIIVPPSV
jgi:hypothetical protein